MTTRARRLVPLAALTGLAVLGAAPAARATLEIRIVGPGVSTTIVDQTPDDQDTDGGLIAVDVEPVNAALAAAGIRLAFSSLHAMSSLPANLPGAVLSIGGELGATAVGGGSVTIEVTDTDYLLPSGAVTLISTASQSCASAGGRWTVRGGFNPTNIPFALDEPAPQVAGALVGTRSSAGTTTVGPLAASAAYGLTGKTAITLKKGEVSFHGSTVAAPEE
jgi:hypothetical protein